MEGTCHNAYLQAKLKVSYDELKKEVERIHAKKKAGQKSMDALLDTLAKLAFFSVDLSLLPLFLDFLDNEDDKLLRRSYSFLLSMAALHNERAVHMNAIQARFTTESQHVGLRSVFSLLTFSAFDYSLTGKPLTVDKIKSRIHADDATDVETSDVKKKKAASSKFKFLSSKKVDDSGQEQLLVLTGYLFITRAWLKDQINDKDVPVRHVFFLAILNACKVPFPSLGVQAMGLCQYLAKNRPAIIKEPFSTFLSEEQDRIMLSDPRARVALAQLCGEFADKSDVYKNHLHQLLRDDNVRVSTAAITALIRGNWKSLTEEPLVKKGNSTDALYKVIGGKLKEMLGSDDYPTVHAACRLTSVMAEKYITYYYNDLTVKERSDMELRADFFATMEICVILLHIQCHVDVVSGENHPLWFLQQRLYQLLEKGNVSSFIRLKILQSLIWLSYAEDTETLEKVIINSIPNLPSDLFNLILEELRRRVSVLTTTDFSDTTLHLFHSIFKTSPEKINPEMLTSVWSTIVAFGEAGRSKVLKSIMAFADTLGSPFTAHSHADTAANVALKKAIFWFLGEHANLLSGERFEHHGHRTRTPASPRGHAPGLSKDDSVKDKKTKETDKDKEKDDKKKGSSKTTTSSSSKKPDDVAVFEVSARQAAESLFSSSPPGPVVTPRSTLRPSNSLRQYNMAEVNNSSPRGIGLNLSGLQPSPSHSAAPTPTSGSTSGLPVSSPSGTQLSKRAASLIPSASDSHIKTLPQKVNLDQIKTLSQDIDRTYTHRDMVGAASSAQFATVSAHGLGGARRVADRRVSSASVAAMPFGGRGLSFPVAREKRHYGSSGFTFTELTPNFVEQELRRGLGHFEDLGGLGNSEDSALRLPSIGNGLMEQILVRIEYALGFSDWEVRLTCLESLAKIAFRSSYRVKLHVYSFLQLLVRDNSMALSSDVLPILLTLHKIMATYELHRERHVTSCDAAEAQALLEAIRRHCTLDKGVDPVHGLAVS